ncbi:MAG: PAS-domain containing protein, partial [Alphaproteobacteria bacterium]|nr:PAS-domain containing protein [Alphaproteobacteria bacterium]
MTEHRDPAVLPLQHAVEAAIIAIVYFVMGYVGQVMAIQPGNVTVVWPPSGIALAVLMMIGPRSLVGIWIGAFAINFHGFGLAEGTTDFLPGVLAAVSIAVGSCLQPLLGWVLMRRFVEADNPVDNLNDAVRFGGIAVAMCLVSASIGVPSLGLAGLMEWQNAAFTWATWWLGDTAGVLVFMPLTMFVMGRSLVKGAILAVLLIIGVGATYATHQSMVSEAESAWAERGERAADRLTSTMLFWLDLSYAPLQGFGAMFNGSENVTEDEFLDAVDSFEDSQSEFFPASIAFLTQNEGGKWRIEMSSDDSGQFAIGSDLSGIPAASKAIAAAREFPGQVILGAAYRDNAGRTKGLATLEARNENMEGVLIALVDLNKMIEGLFQLRDPDGMSLRLSVSIAGAKFGSKSALVYGRPKPPEDTVKSVSIRSLSAKSQLEFTWDISPKFRGGPVTDLAAFVLIGGIVGTVVLTLFIGFLLAQHEKISMAVEERTAEVAQKSDLLKAVLDSMAQAVIAFDKDLHLVTWNDKLVDIRGYTPEMLEEGRPFSNFMRHDVERNEFGPGDPEKIFDEKVENAHDFSHHEFERQRPDGTFIEVRGGPIPGGGFVSTYSDITDRKQVEEQVRESEQRLLGILEQSPVGVWITRMDDDPRIVFANSRVAQMIGLNKDDIVGKSPTDIGYGAKSEEMNELMMSGSPVTNHEMLLERADGSAMWGLFTITEIEYEGRPARLGWAYEITQRKEAETKLEGQLD